MATRGLLSLTSFLTMVLGAAPSGLHVELAMSNSSLVPVGDEPVRDRRCLAVPTTVEEACFSNLTLV